MTGTHVLVTGGLGYIGSALLPRLQANDDVAELTVLDSLASGSPRTLLEARLDDAFRFRRGDVRTYGEVETAMDDVDVVIHLAAITGADSTRDRREETMAVNRDGTENVLRAAEKRGVDRVVFASSCNNYGRTASRDIAETDEMDPLNPYAESKVRSEDLLAEYADRGLETTALRMSTNYGYAPGVRYNLVVNYFVFRAVVGLPLTVYGDGSNWRPFVHVRDAARAFASAALEPDRWPQQVYNVGHNDANYRIGEIADIVSEVVAPVDVTYLEDENPGPSYHVNFDRVAATGFEPHWTLREGVDELATVLREAADPLDTHE
ncbi:MAG: NAD-dependent epimerase/dehydratase family protein [Halorientalis sp.]